MFLNRKKQLDCDKSRNPQISKHRNKQNLRLKFSNPFCDFENTQKYFEKSAKLNLWGLFFVLEQLLTLSRESWKTGRCANYGRLRVKVFNTRETDQLTLKVYSPKKISNPKKFRILKNFLTLKNYFNPKNFLTLKNTLILNLTLAKTRTLNMILKLTLNLTLNLTPNLTLNLTLNLNLNLTLKLTLNLFLNRILTQEQTNSRDRPQGTVTYQTLSQGQSSGPPVGNPN